MTAFHTRAGAAGQRALAGGLLGFGLLALAGCASPTPVPTPTPEPTLAPPTETATAEASATLSATATLSVTATSEPTVAPPTLAATTAAQPAGPTAPPVTAAPRPSAVPPPLAYDVQLWADQPNLPKDLGCTVIHWNVIGAKEVWLRWPNQGENQVEAKGTQEGVCIDEGERAVFTLRVVKPDGSDDVREMVLEREE